MTLPEQLARATILFLRGGAWTREDYANWESYTGSPISTINALITLAEKVIQYERDRAKGPAETSDSTRGVPENGPVISGELATKNTPAEVIYDYSAPKGTIRPLEPGRHLERPDR